MRTLKIFGIGQLAAIVLLTILLLIGGAILMNFNIEPKIISVISLIFLIIGALSAAFITSVLIGRRGWLVGMAAGLLFMFIIGLIGLISGLATFGSGVWLSLLIMLASGAVGGMLGMLGK